MRELDGKHMLHQCVLLAPRGMPAEKLGIVRQEALKAFANVRVLQTTRLEERPWPIAPNAMFRCFLKWAAVNHPGYFWWNEPDCLPLKTKWADLIEEQYLKCGKPFMGFVVGKPKPHLTGCAVYPSDAARYNRALETGPDNVAWDCIDPERTLKHAHHTDLFHHQWVGFNGQGQPSFPAQDDLKQISTKAVVFHRNKDQSLIDRLRENRAALENGLEAGRRHRLLVARTRHTDTVHTYYEDLDRPEEAKIIKLWRESWEENGWKVAVLGDRDSHRYLGRTSFLRAVSKFPSINPPGYDLACYKRWITMVAFGGGLMVDYDVINRGFTPAMAAEHKTDNALVFFEERVPCAVLGCKAKFQFACEWLKNYQPRVDDVINGQPHVSDMLILQRVWGAPWLKHVPLAKQPNQPGWETALLVHYSNHSTGGNKLAAIEGSMLEPA